jgi:hypothetical protein
MNVLYKQAIGRALFKHYKPSLNYWRLHNWERNRFYREIHICLINNEIHIEEVIRNCAYLLYDA